MKFSSSHPIQFAAAVIALLTYTPATRAQQPPSRDLASIRSSDRVVNAIDGDSTVVLPFTRHPLAKPEFDLGDVSPSARLERMMLVLQPSRMQVESLERLLAEQQDPASPIYQHWLAPEDFGRSFGVSPSDYNRLTKWLETQGFDVEPPDAALRVLVFSGTVEQVQATFNTKIHAFRVGARVHWANVTAPSLPQALAGVVRGFVSLHDFGRQAYSRILSMPAASEPELTSGASHYLAPADFAKIYDLNGLYSNATDGTGQSIAVIGRCNIKVADIKTFRSAFALPTNDPTVIVNGADPGIPSLNEQAEAQLDVEWSGAVAPGAAIKMIVSASTRVSDGIDLSAQYAVSHNVAPVITVSFGSCESGMGITENQFWNSLWQQAAAQGMTVLVASGDSGAAGCDGSSSANATLGAAVNGLCSSPYSTCVGGTQFNDIANPSVYWLPTSAIGTNGSALSYIPEITWNESSSVAGGSGLWSSGGGASIVYAKPTWQSGIGVPTEGHRDVPDVALNSASHDGYVVIINGGTYVVGGTSVASPSFAGLMALTVQHQSSRVGNANPALYQLASLQAKGGANVFHDVASGDNSVPGLIGFSATTGYDRVTGLGSVDAMVMVNHWSDAATPLPAPAFQLSTSAVGITVTQGTKTSVPLSLTVSGGFSASVNLAVSGIPGGLSAVLSPSVLPIPGSGSSTLTLTAASTITPGSYPLTLTATGGGVSRSTALSVVVLRSCTFAVTPLTTSVGATTGSYSASVTATTGCSWSATSTATWISVTAGASGIGNGSVGYAVSTNSTSTSRKGIVTIAGQTMSVTQAATTAVQQTALTLKASVSTISFVAAGGVVPVTVIATPITTPWTAVSNSSWIVIISGTGPAAGSRAVSISVAANSSGATRVGTITMGSISIPVNQAGIVCSYAITIGPLSPATGGVMGSVAVTTATGCPWTSTSNVGWITIQSGKTASGPGTTTFLVANNTNSAARTGILTVAGRTITLTESKNASLKLAPQ